MLSASIAGMPLWVVSDIQDTSSISTNIISTKALEFIIYSKAVEKNTSKFLIYLGYDISDDEKISVCRKIDLLQKTKIISLQQFRQSAVCPVNVYNSEDNYKISSPLQVNGLLFKSSLHCSEKIASDLNKEKKIFSGFLIESTRQMISSICENFFSGGDSNNFKGLLIHHVDAKFSDIASIVPDEIHLQITHCTFEMNSSIDASAQLHFLNGDSSLAQIMVSFSVQCDVKLPINANETLLN